MSGFVQIVEYKTSQMDEMMKFGEDWRQRYPEMGPSRIVVSRDRDNAGTYLSIVEFESYESAMKNSEDPLTQEFAAKMASLCDGPPTFRNLDILRLEQRYQ